MRSFLIVMGVMLSFAVIGQHHVCGTSHHAQEQMIKQIQEYRKAELQVRSDDTLYFPMTIHLVGNDNGEQYHSVVKVIEQMHKLKEDYRGHKMVPYIKEIRFLPSSKILNGPSEYQNLAFQQKDSGSVNLFITNNASTGSSGTGTVLGYFTPQADFLVVRKANLNGDDSTLSHEAGHFFSLPHTFYGWENNAYNSADHGNPVELTIAPGIPVPIELMDGSNCDTAADNICDTPPDYNFGFGASVCALTKIVRDSNGDTIKTMANNYMGYFLQCDKYEFTQGQIDVMRNNFNSSSRAYLRSEYIPDTTRIGEYNILTTAEELKTQPYDLVALDWEDAEGATAYAVTVRPIFGKSSQHIVTDSYLEIEGLDKEDIVTVEIVAYNEGSFASSKKEINFNTSRFDTPTFDPSIITDFKVYPNPTRVGKDIVVRLSTERASDVQYEVYDIRGSLVFRDTQSDVAGTYIHNINTLGWTTGVYVVKVKTEFGFGVHRVILNK